jgi:hypothetical protein
MTGTLRVTPDNVEAVVEAFEHDSSLRIAALEISECTSSQLPVMLETLIDCLPLDSLSETESLAVDACIIAIDAVQPLARLLRRCPAMLSVSLDLCDWKYSSVLRKALLDPKNASLNHFNSSGEPSDLARNHWTVFKTAYMLVHALVKSVELLSEVRINRCSAAAVWRPFCDGVQASLVSLMFAVATQGLARLEMRGNFITDAFLRDVVVAKSLESISLADNRITDTGLGLVLASLEGNLSLRRLDLEGNLITLTDDTVWVSLESVLSNNPELRIILSGNPVERNLSHPQLLFEDCQQSPVDDGVNVSTGPSSPVRMQTEDDEDEDSDFTGSDSAVASSASGTSDSDVSLVSEGSDTWKLLDD